MKNGHFLIQQRRKKRNKIQCISTLSRVRLNNLKCEKKRQLFFLLSKRKFIAKEKCNLHSIYEIAVLQNVQWQFRNQEAIYWKVFVCACVFFTSKPRHHLRWMHFSCKCQFIYCSFLSFPQEKVFKQQILSMHARTAFDSAATLSELSQAITKVAVLKHACTSLATLTTLCVWTIDINPKQ